MYIKNISESVDKGKQFKFSSHQEFHSPRKQLQ